MTSRSRIWPLKLGGVNPVTKSPVATFILNRFLALRPPALVKLPPT